MKEMDVISYLDLMLAAQRAKYGDNSELARSMALKALRLAPRLPHANGFLGQFLMERGDWKQADQLLRKAYLLRRARRAPSSVAFVKLKHNLEQLEYLSARKLLSKNISKTLPQLRKLVATASIDGYSGGKMVDLRASAKKVIAESYDKATYLYSPGPLPGGALNPKLDFREIEKSYFKKNRRVVIFDDLLVPKALEQIRRFCLESTFWNAPKLPGYVGAFSNDGFSCGLLFQIADELKKRLPRIYQDHPLRNAWALKYDQKLAGVGLHADMAKVNSNFWITPDSANLNPGNGGLVIWPCEIPASWPARDYTSYETASETKRMRLLKKSKASPIKVPYRQNRIVIFDSHFLHESDDLQFREGYENRRMNITFLHGNK